MFRCSFQKPVAFEGVRFSTMQHFELEARSNYALVLHLHPPHTLHRYYSTLFVHLLSVLRHRVPSSQLFISSHAFAPRSLSNTHTAFHHAQEAVAGLAWPAQRRLRERHPDHSLNI